LLRRRFPFALCSGEVPPVGPAFPLCSEEVPVPKGGSESLHSTSRRPRPSRTQISAKLGPRGSGQKNAHGGYFADVQKEAACAEFFASWLKYLFTSIRRNLRKLRIMLFVLFRRILRNKLGKGHCEGFCTMSLEKVHLRRSIQICRIYQLTLRRILHRVCGCY